MRFCVIFSEQDTASMNIKDKLVKKGIFRQKSGHLEHDNIMLLTTPVDSIRCDNIDHDINADVIVFATRHESKKGLPSLCVHAPGNWGMAEYGGRDNQLCTAPARLLRAGFLILHRMAKGLRFEVIQEATHHGPYVDKPCIFIEIGSTAREWDDAKAGTIIADAILELAKASIKKTEVAVGIGGLHHAPRFSRQMLNHDVAFGHICPKYNLANLSKSMLLQAIEKTYEKIDFICLDWKGLGQHKQRIIEMLDNLGVGYKKVK